MTTISDLQLLIEERTTAIDIGWVIFCGSMVFITQLGFFALESGKVSDLWINSIILKNFEDAFAGILLFSMFGYSIIRAPSIYGIICGYNTDYFLLHNVPEEEYITIFYQSLYAIASTTIVSSCVLERIKNIPYLCTVAFLTTIQYPILVHWCWTNKGWLHSLGYIDFSGGGVVHISGGIIGLILIIYLGDRYSGSSNNSKSALIQTAHGVLILWFGWYGFNCGAAMSVTENPLQLARVALNTSLSSAAGGAVASLLVSNREINTTVNGVLVGLVAMTSGPHLFKPWAAVATGAMGGCIIVFWKKFILLKFSLDDPLSATAVHVGGGIISVLSTGLFANDAKNNIYGLVYGPFVHYELLVSQIIGVCAISALSLVSAFLLCFMLESTIGLKVDIFQGYLEIEENRENASETLNSAIRVRTPTTNAWLFNFHKFLAKRLTFEHLDFLIACNRFLTKMEYLQKKYAIDDTQKKKSIAIINADKQALIDLYLMPDSDYVVNVSSAMLMVFKKRRNIMDTNELRTLLLEVYADVLRMMQIPFTEWIRECFLAQQANKKNKLQKEQKHKFSRFNIVKNFRIAVHKRASTNGEMFGNDDSHTQIHGKANKYRKVYSVKNNYMIDWKCTKYRAEDHCLCIYECFKSCMNWKTEDVIQIRSTSHGILPLPSILSSTISSDMKMKSKKGARPQRFRSVSLAVANFAPKRKMKAKDKTTNTAEKLKNAIARSMIRNSTFVTQESFYDADLAQNFVQ